MSVQLHRYPPSPQVLSISTPSSAPQGEQRGQQGRQRGPVPRCGLPPLPLSPFLPPGCVYAVVSLPFSSVSFRCSLISQESRVPLPQPVPSSGFYLAALFSAYIRSAALRRLPPATMSRGEPGGTVRGTLSIPPPAPRGGRAAPSAPRRRGRALASAVTLSPSAWGRSREDREETRTFLCCNVS